MQAFFRDRTDRRIVILYIIWEMCNLIAIEYSYGAFPYEDQCRIMYLSIMVNTVVTLYFFVRYGFHHHGRHNLLALALAVTAAADYYLTLKSLVLPGYSLFCLVQCIYALYFKPSAKNLLLRAGLYGAALAALGMSGMWRTDYILGALNLTLLAVNVICAWIHNGKDQTGAGLCLAVGLSLFAGCDYSLLIRELTTDPVRTMFNDMVWFFYVPAQLLLVLAYGLKSAEKRRTFLK